VVRHGNGIYQRNQKCEKNANAKGKSQHHKNSAHTSGERSQKTPPIEMRMKIKDAHGAAKLPPAVLTGEKNGRANQNEDETDARPQKQETGFAIFSEKFQHAVMLDDSLGEINAKVDRPVRGRCQTLAASAAIITIEQGTARSTMQRERFIS